MATTKQAPFGAADIRAALDLAKLIRAQLIQQGILPPGDHRPSEVLDALRNYKPPSCTD